MEHKKLWATVAAVMLIGGASAVTYVSHGTDRQPEGSPQMSTTDSAEQGPEVDPEGPVIDGPAPLTRQDFARDSKPDSNTVKEPLRPIGPATTDGGSESVAGRTG